MAKIHSYPWYPADWRGSEARLTMTLEERCIYRELLDHHYEQGSLPSDERGLRMIAGCDKEEFDRAWPRVSKQFYEQDGRLYQARVLEKLVELGELSEKRKSIAQKAAAARFKHASSNAPRMLEACLKHSPSNALSMLEECSPSSSTTTTTSSSLDGKISVVPTKPKQPTNEEDHSEEIQQIAARIRKRHPTAQKMTEAEIVQQLISIQKPTETLIELARVVDDNHASICDADESLGGWKRREARFIPTLRRWMTTAARDPTERPKVPTYEDLKSQEWMA